MVFYHSAGLKIGLINQPASELDHNSDSWQIINELSTAAFNLIMPIFIEY